MQRTSCLGPTGPLVPDHVLILPIMHVPSSMDLGDDSTTELNKYKAALLKYFKSKDLSCVFFERNFASRHMQVQVWDPAGTLSLL